MILELYIFLVALCFAFVIGGYYVDAPVLEIAGFAFLFLLGITMFQGSLEYETGFNESVAANNVTHRFTEYQAWDDGNSHLIGVYTAIVAVLGFVTVLSQLTGWGREIFGGLRNG